MRLECLSSKKKGVGVMRIKKSPELEDNHVVCVIQKTAQVILWGSIGQKVESVLL